MMDLPAKYKKPKPRISLDESDLPAMKNWEVGKMYNIMAKVKMVHQSEGEEYAYSDNEGEKPKMRATLKLVSMNHIPDKKGKKSGKMMMRVNKS